MVFDGPGTTDPEQSNKAGEPTRRQRTRPERPWAQHWAAVFSLVPLGLLAAAMWFGRWVRPSGDEWCFLPVVRDGGLTGMLEKFYVHDNGRVANALLVWAYARFGVPGHQWFALISGLVVVGVLWAVTLAAVRRAGVTVPRGMPLLVASMVAVLFLFASPNTYKTFYWPAASVSHTLAPVLAGAAVIPLLRARSRTAKITALLVVFLTGVFIGTLSEQSSVCALVLLSGVLLLGRWIVPGPRRSYVRLWCLVGTAGTVIGTLVLVTSPGSRNRQHGRDAGMASMLAPESLIGAAKGFVRILETLLTTWPYAGAVAVGVLLGALATRADSGTAPLVKHLLLTNAAILAFLLSGYLCTLAAYPVFGPAVATSTRLWNDFRFLYILLLLGIGVLLGHRLRRHTLHSVALVVAGTAFCGLVCVVFALSLHQLEHTMRMRAHQWDRQDQWLRTQAERGARELPYRPTPISKMTEPLDGGWPSGCVARYYHLDRITPARVFPWQ